MGTLFTSKALVGDDKEGDDSSDGDYDDDGMSPDMLRHEFFENMLKRRIFYADRYEKVEK